MLEIVRPARLAFRKLVRAPLFTSIAAGTLALGIGANAAIFAVVDAVLIKPLPYENAESLVSLRHTAPGLNLPIMEQADAVYLADRAENRSFVDIGLFDDTEYTLTGASRPEQISGVLVTDGTLPLLGVRPVLGRLFTAADDQMGAPPTVMLSHAFWERRFGKSPSALGQTLTLGGTPHEIIGILPPRFAIASISGELYTTFRIDPALARTINFSFKGLGRLKPGVTIEAATADLARLLPVAVDRYSSYGLTQKQLIDARVAPVIRPLKEDVVGNVGAVLWVLMGSVGLILLLACANVANLFLVQAEGRQREVAVRTALGASRADVIGGLLGESLLLGAFAGAIGLGLAFGGLQLLQVLGPSQLPRVHEIAVDWRVLAFTAGASLLTGILFGLYPALRYGRLDLHPALKEGGRSVGTGRERHRVRNALVVVQVALALILLIGSGLMIRTLQALRAVDPGFEKPDQVLTFRLFLPKADVPEAERLRSTYATIFERLAALPGVQAVGGADNLPLPPDYGNRSPILVEGEPITPDLVPKVQRYVFSYPGFPEALQARLVAGRSLTWADIHSRTKAVLVSENLAREKWGEPQAAVGRRLADNTPMRANEGPDWFEVVGVLGDIRYDGVDQPPPTTVYWPFEMERFYQISPWVLRSIEIAVRTSRPPAALMREVERAVWDVNPNLPLANQSDLGAILDRSMARSAFAMFMLSIAAAVALLLGLVGIYGVVSFIVTERTQEIGLRIALGADPARVRRMVIGEATVVAAIGIGIGLVAAAGLTRAMTGILHGVRPLDPITYGGVAIVLTLVAIAASWLPARRAANLDPIRALRAD